MPAIPAPGPPLGFHQWTSLLTQLLRELLPTVSAAREGHTRVVWRYEDRIVSCFNDRGAFCFTLGSADQATTTATLFDRARHDHFTAFNFARTLAGHFDSRLSVL